MVTQVEVAQAIHKAPTFDADRVAYLEVAGLRDYYDHKWLSMLWKVVQLMHEQFGLSWPRAIQAAYYVTRASIAWAPKDNDPRATRRYIRKFYRLAARYGSNPHMDPVRVAESEFKYWVLHRRYSGQPSDQKQPYIQSLVELHSALFGLPADAVWSSALNRARATDHMDEVTGHRSTDIEADWHEAEHYLREAYRSVTAQL